MNMYETIHIVSRVPTLPKTVVTKAYDSTAIRQRDDQSTTNVTIVSRSVGLNI